MVRIKAKEELEEIKKYLGLTIEFLSHIVIDECSGTEDFTDGYKEKLRVSLNSLLEIRNIL